MLRATRWLGGSYTAQWLVITSLSIPHPRSTAHAPAPARIHHPKFRLLSLSHPQSAQSQASPAAALLESGEQDVVTVDDQSSGSGAVTLRPYQETAISACVSALQTGLTRIGVSSPTGSGKTTMFMSLIPRVNGTEQRTRTLIIVSSVELASQAEAAARRLLGSEYKIEVEQGKRTASGSADVTIGTYQTLNNVDRLKKFDPRRFKLAIVDEAHHAAAFSYMRLLHYFNQDVELPSMIPAIHDDGAKSKVPIVGFSATFSRPDQLALSAVFQKIVFHRDVTQMLDEGWLSPAKSTTVQCDLHLDQVEINALGDYKTSSLAPYVNTPSINQLIVRTYLHRAGDRRSTLIFCVDLDHVANVTDAFRSAGIDARSISSISAPQARRDTLETFSRGDFPVLVNCEVLTEGTDIPVIDCVILARPTKSRNLLAQMVGRGIRLSPDTGKVDCLIVDIVDSVSRSGGMLVSPTLFGLTHDELAEERAEREEAADSASSDAQSGSSESSGGSRVKSVTFVDEDDPFRVGSSARLPIAKLSSNAWVACGGDRYILEMLGNGYISIDPQIGEGGEDGWVIRYRHKLPVNFGSTRWYSRVRQVGLAHELERAMQTADKYAERSLGRDLYSKLSRYAEWRKRPASPKAVATLLKIKGLHDTAGVKEIEVMGRKVPLSSLTAGQAAALLCAASHGAMNIRQKEDRAAATRERRLQAKAEKARAKEARNLPLPATS